MEELQEQIRSLTIKVDLMCQTLEQLSRKVVELVSEQSLKATPDLSPHSLGTSVSRPTYNGSLKRDMSLEHKDVLADDDYFEKDAKNKERLLSPELQIQRLTAQLTAAYNRIAALEEQLLAQRIH